MTLGFVESGAAGGTTTEAQAYLFTASRPSQTDTLTYRLQQVDLDGTQSNICPLQIGDGPDMPVMEGIAPIQSDETVDFSGFGVATDSVANPDTVTVNRFPTGPSSTDGIQESNVSSYRFVVRPDSLTLESDAEVRLDSQLPGISEPTNVTIYKRPEDGSGSFTQLTTSYDAQMFELVAPVESFSEFVLASNSEPLPVELANFNATQTSGNARLTWQTAFETNNAGFEVQRRVEDTSAPGTRQKESGWTQVGYVDSKASGGTTTNTKSYRFTAEDVPVGTHQFRLKQVDLDGSSTLIDPVTVDIQMQEALKLTAPAPNPASTSAALSFAVKEQAETTIQLYNTLGQQVATVYEGTPQAGERQRAQVDVSGLSSGTYFLRLEADGKTATRQVTVLR